MEKIRCTVDGANFHNSENGWSVLRVKLESTNKPLIVTGTFAEVPTGFCLEVEGEYRDDPRYGRQFVAAEWRQVMPASVKGIERYLASAGIKGIAKTMAHTIVQRFGADTIDVLDNDIDRLREIPGLGAKRIEQIKAGWKHHSDMRKVMIGLQGCGISSAYASRIYKVYGTDAVDKIKHNPYILADDIDGIGFRTADDIATSMGFAADNPCRIAAGVLYVLGKIMDDGHVFALADDLRRSAASMLACGEDTVDDAIDSLIDDKKITADGEAVYIPMYYHAERGAARKLKALLAARGDKIKVKAPDKAPEGMAYDPVQLEAIARAAAEKVMVLTGGPGTGKTTTVKGIIETFKAGGLKIRLAAPTGRAAKRMSETTGMEAMTIHRLLEYNPFDGFVRNAENPLEGDVLIVDECSMIDLMLFYCMVKAMPAKMRLVMVGDVDQLPSVGAGNVLHDVIASGVIPVVRLTRIFRQALSSRIVTNAHAINAGNMPDISNGSSSDFFFINTPDEAIAETIVNLVSTRLPKAYGLKPADIQVLTPMYKGEAGASALNDCLRAAINPCGTDIKRGDTIFRTADKVMQIKNNYDKNVFNGDIGYIVKIDRSDDKVLVRFDSRVIEYAINELDELMPAYAVTIHKSQGSEFPIVVMPVTNKHYVMLQRNLIYTGVTRAKKVCVLVGNARALSYAVGNYQVRNRNSRLADRLLEG